MKLVLFLVVFVVVGYSDARSGRLCLVPKFLPTTCNGGYQSIIVAGADGPNGKNGSPGARGPRGPRGDPSPSCKHPKCNLHLSIFKKVKDIQKEVRRIDNALDLLTNVPLDKLPKLDLLNLVDKQKKTIYDSFKTIKDLGKKIKELNEKLKKKPTNGVDPKKYKKLQKENEKKNKKLKNLLKEIKKLHKKMKDCSEKDKKIANLKWKLAKLAHLLKGSGLSVHALGGLQKKLNHFKKQLRDKLKKLNKELAKLKHQLKNKTKANSHLHQKIKELQKKLKSHQKAAKSLLGRGNAKLRKKLRDCSKKFKAADKHQKAIIKKLKDHLAALGAKAKGAAQLKKKIDELNKKLKDLTDTEENLVFTTLDPKFAMMVVPKLERKLYKRYTHNGRITLPGKMGSDGSGPYVVMMNREDGSETFMRNIKDYQTGFGSLKGESWLGLDILQALTCGTKYQLRIELTDFKNKVYHANYKVFKIAEGYGYKIHTSGFSGNIYNALSLVEGQKFSTNDNDQDKSGRKSCAKKNGGWWYKNCKFGSLTGKYFKRPTRNHNGVTWYDVKGKPHHNYSWKKAVMLVKPVHCSWRSKLTGRSVGKGDNC